MGLRGCMVKATGFMSRSEIREQPYLYGLGGSDIIASIATLNGLFSGIDKSALET